MIVKEDGITKEDVNEFLRELSELIKKSPREYFP
jgi:hypothetical protein